MAADPKSDQKSFLLRLPKPILDAYQKWAEDELRSLNGQLEYTLREVLKAEGRLPKSESRGEARGDQKSEASPASKRK